MWNDLPLDLQGVIVRQLDDKTVFKHRRELRLCGKAFAQNIFYADWVSSTRADIVVSGILHLCFTKMHSAVVKWRLSTDIYALIYSRVYDLCTAHAPLNRSQKLYAELMNLMPKWLRKCESHTARRQFVKLISHSFNYLNRFYCKCFNLPKLKDSFDAMLEELGACA